MGLFRRENSDAAKRERLDQLDRVAADGLRTLADIFKRAAELVEKRRLERNGYQKQEEYLRRVPGKEKP